jgi:hypothetical protein
VDPSDPSGNTYAAVNFALADGSVRFVGTDATGTLSLVGADEFFARFADTALDDQALLATTHGCGLASQITHDVEFEGWASVSRFDRTALPSLNTVVGSDHAWGNFPRNPDHALSIPRMNSAVPSVMAEWSSDRG